MPSPVGHGLAGLAIALAGDRSSDSATFRRALTRPATLVCVALATLPDADLLPGFHRHATHRIAATIAVTIVAMLVTGWVTQRRRQALGFGLQEKPWLRRIDWRIVFLCAAAHASHIVLDWLGADRSEPSGLQIFWPWSDRFFMSGWDVFPQIERRQIFSLNSMLINLNAFAWELVLMGPLVALAWWLRRAGRAGRAGKAG
jgi:membrane-bound metal-dependent hydrolase YbcI (DUF457 family)